MPQLRLEYSANIKEKIDVKELFSPCHAILVDTINADLFRCQSRAVCREDFYLGEGLPQEAFVYLEILFLEGRTPAQSKEAGEKILQHLERYFARSLKELHMQIAVRLVEVPRSLYFKKESNRP